jgi:hypothetical protein
MVCNKDVTNAEQRNPGESQLTGNTVATVNYVRIITDEYHLSWGGPLLSRPGSARGPQENQPGPWCRRSSANQCPSSDCHARP